MEISARNQIPATVKSVQLDGVMAEVILQFDGGTELVAAITRTSAERLGLAPGNVVVAVVKATEVMVATP